MYPLLFAQYFEEFKDYCTKTDNNALEKAYKMVKNLTTLRGRVQARAKSKALTKVDAQAKLKADDKERAEAQAKAEARSTDAKVEAKWDEDYDKKAQEDGEQTSRATRWATRRRRPSTTAAPPRRRSERRRRQWQPTHLHDRAGPQPTAARRRPKTPALLGPVVTAATLVVFKSTPAA